MNWGDLSVMSRVTMNWTDWMTLTKTGINWNDMNVMAKAGVNWSDWTTLSKAGVNWSDMNVMAKAGVNWEEQLRFRWYGSHVWRRPTKSNSPTMNCWVMAKAFIGRMWMKILVWQGCCAEIVS